MCQGMSEEEAQDDLSYSKNYKDDVFAIYDSDKPNAVFLTPILTNEDVKYICLSGTFAPCNNLYSCLCIQSRQKG
jgi:hypothetical protein